MDGRGVVVKPTMHSMLENHRAMAVADGAVRDVEADALGDDAGLVGASEFEDQARAGRVALDRVLCVCLSIPARQPPTGWKVLEVLGVAIR